MGPDSDSCTAAKTALMLVGKVDYYYLRAALAGRAEVLFFSGSLSAYGGQKFGSSNNIRVGARAPVEGAS